MKTRTTLILLLITLGAGAWLLLKERGGPLDLRGHLLFDWSDSARAMDQKQLTVDVKSADVAGMDLRSSTAEISLRRQPDGFWEITKGALDRADAAGIKALLDFLETAQITDLIERSELTDGTVSASSLGLDDAGAWRISWLNAAGQPLAEARVGRTAPLDKEGYVELSGVARRPDIYIIKPDLRPLLARPLESWRDERACRYNEDQLSKLVIRVGEGEVELSRTLPPGLEPTPWVITRPLASATTEPKIVKELTSAICGLKALSWLPYTDTTDKPLVELTVFPAAPAGAKGTTLAFYPDPAVTDPAAPGATALCRDAQRKAAFKVLKETVDYFALVDSPNPLRSRKLPEMMEPGVMSTVEVRTPVDSVVLARVGNKWSWRPLAGGAWADAAVEKLEKLIEAVNDGDVLDFASDSLADPKTFALDAPDYIITFAAGRHVSLEKLTPMTRDNSRTLRISIREDGHIFANYAGDPFVYRIGPEIPSAIPQSFIKWRSLNLTSFSLPQVRALQQTMGTGAALELTYDNRTTNWTAVRGGENVLPLLLKGAAENIASRLGTLSVSSWLEKPDDALKALETPAVTIEVTYEAWGEKASDLRLETATLTLAPLPAAQATLCYGRLSTVPDPFLIPVTVLRDMSTHLVGRPPR